MPLQTWRQTGLLIRGDGPVHLCLIGSIPILLSWMWSNQSTHRTQLRVSTNRITVRYFFTSFVQSIIAPLLVKRVLSGPNMDNKSVLTSIVGAQGSNNECLIGIFGLQVNRSIKRIEIHFHPDFLFPSSVRTTKTLVPRFSSWRSRGPREWTSSLTWMSVWGSMIHSETFSVSVVLFDFSRRFFFFIIVFNSINIDTSYF